jgi:hypothetical protein
VLHRLSLSHNFDECSFSFLFFFVCLVNSAVSDDESVQSVHEDIAPMKACGFRRLSYYLLKHTYLYYLIVS